MVVEATGSRKGLQQAIAMLAPRGTLVLKSTFHGAAKFETWPIVVHEINIVGSRCGPFEPAIRLLAHKQIDVESLIQARYSLNEGVAAFAHAAQKGALAGVSKRIKEGFDPKGVLNPGRMWAGV